MDMKTTDEEYKIISDQLEDKLGCVSFCFWMDDMFEKYLTEENKWILLLAYQRGYAKAIEDKEYQ